MFRNVTFKQLEVFERIAATGSFTAAARGLHSTQSTVSMQMKKLEEALKTPLFEQVGRRVHLTVTGRTLLGACDALFATVERLESSLATDHGVIGGTLTFAGVTTTEYFAPLLLAAFQRHYPEVSISLNISDRENLLRRLRDNRDDLYLLDQPPADIEVSLVPFIENPLVMVAPPWHPLTRRRHIPIEDLREEKFLLREPSSGTRIALKELLLGQGVTLKVGMELSSNEALKRAVASGMGLSILSKYAVAMECNRGELAALDVTGFPLVENWYIVHSKDKHIPPAGAAFIQFLLEQGKDVVESSLV